MSSELLLTLLVGPDTPDGCVRLDMTDAHLLGAAPGDVVTLEGARRSHARVLPAFMEDRNQKIARVSEITARNIGFLHGRSVRVLFDKSKPTQAELLTLEAADDVDRLHLLVRQEEMPSLWQRAVLSSGDEVVLPTLDSHILTARIAATQPATGPVVVTHATQILVSAAKDQREDSFLPHLGGMRDVFLSCRDLVAARFRKTGGANAGSVLLTGPSGCGKAFLVKKLAEEMDLSLRIFDCHLLLDQVAATGISDLNLSLTEMTRRGPALFLIDHLEALDERANLLAGPAHTVLSQISAMLEEVAMQPNALLFVVSSRMPQERLLKGRLFATRFVVDFPNRWGRHEILLSAARGKKLAQGVDFGKLAEISGGLNARDIAGFVEAAALAADEKPLTQKNLIEALQVYAPAGAAQIRCEVPPFSWEDIAGFDDIKKNLHETLVWSLKEHEKFSVSGVVPPRFILISGSQGTGKTALVRATASFLPVHYIEISCLLLVTRDEAEGKKRIQDIFSLARRKAPCLVFLDDIDAFFEGCMQPENGIFIHPVLEQLITDLDTIAERSGVVVIAATDRPDRLTNDLMRTGRFDYALALPLPDADARKKIFQTYVRKMPLAADVDFERLAAVTQGFCPADIVDLCNRVGLMAFRRSLGGPQAGVIPPVLDAALFEQGLRGRKNEQ